MFYVLNTSSAHHVAIFFAHHARLPKSPNLNSNIKTCHNNKTSPRHNKTGLFANMCIKDRRRAGRGKESDKGDLKMPTKQGCGKVELRWQLVAPHTRGETHTHKRAISSTAYSRRDTYTDTDKKTQRATSTADKDRGQLAPHTRGEQAVTRCTE
jgi:hypothetical protein